MRTLTAMLAASLFVAGAARATISPIKVPPPRSGPTVLSITQLRTLFPNGGMPMEIKTGARLAEAPPTTTAADGKEGNPVYKTGAGLALTPAIMQNQATSSQLYLYYCMLTSAGVVKSQDGGVQCHFPSALSQNPTMPIVSAYFGQLPQSKHMYLLTLNAFVFYGSLTDNISVVLGNQQVSASDLKVNGETLGVMFIYDAGANAGHTGSLTADVDWTGHNFAQGSAVDFFFYSMQLVQLD